MSFWASVANGVALGLWVFVAIDHEIRKRARKREAARVAVVLELEEKHAREAQAAMNAVMERFQASMQRLCPCPDCARAREQGARTN